MHLTDHLTDVQLNEYLDNETTERALIESHLAECANCAARLTTLKTLFAEIESLPEITLSRSLSPYLILHSASSLTSRPPRWLTLTATFQAALMLTVLILTAPLIANLLPAIKTPSITQTFLQLQSQWTALLYIFTNYQLPSLPQFPMLQISNLMIALTLAVVSALWLVGNRLLLRR
jgi:hypothetical protein